MSPVQACLARIVASEIQHGGRKPEMLEVSAREMVSVRKYLVETYGLFHDKTLTDTDEGPILVAGVPLRIVENW